MRLWPWIVTGIAVVALSIASLAVAVLILLPLRSVDDATRVEVAQTWTARDQATGACVDVRLGGTLEGHEVVPVLPGGPWSSWSDVALTGLAVEGSPGCEPITADMRARVLVTAASPGCESAFVGGPWNRLMGSDGTASVTGCDGLSWHSQVWVTADGSEPLEGGVWEVADDSACIGLTVVAQFIDGDGDRWTRAGDVRTVCLGDA